MYPCFEMSRYVTTANEHRQDTSHWVNNKMGQPMFQNSIETIKLWQLEIKKRCHQCRMNPIQFIFISYRRFRDKVTLFSSLICNVYLT